MADNLRIVTGKEMVDMKLLLLVEPSLPQAAAHVEHAYPFSGLIGDTCVAVAIAEKKNNCYDIPALAVAPDQRRKGIGREMLLHVMDFIRAQGGRFVEVGCGNAQLHLIKLYQRLGFRIVGVWQDYFRDDPVNGFVLDGIQNRDMIRLRADLLSFSPNRD